MDRDVSTAILLFFIRRKLLENFALCQWYFCRSCFWWPKTSGLLASCSCFVGCFCSQHFSIIPKLKSHYFRLTVRQFVLFAFATFLKINLISTFCAARNRLTYPQLINLLKFCHAYYKIGNNRVNSKKQLVMGLSPNAIENKSKESCEHLFNQPMLQRVMTFVRLVAVKSQ